MIRLAPALLILAASQVARAGEHVKLIDQLGAGEIEEATTIYLDDVRAAEFVLNADRPAAQAEVTLPNAPTHTYRMCGKVSVRAPDGEVRSHVVDTSGTLGRLDGRTLEAKTTDFTSYFLEDATPDRRATPIERFQGRGCTPSVS